MKIFLRQITYIPSIYDEDFTSEVEEETKKKDKKNELPVSKSVAVNAVAALSNGAAALGNMVNLTT